MWYVNITINYAVIPVSMAFLMVWTAKLYQKPRGSSPDLVECIMWWLFGALFWFVVPFCLAFVGYLNHRLYRRRKRVFQRN